MSSTDKLMAEDEILASEIMEAELRLTALRAKREALWLKAAGVGVGDIVRITGYKGGQLAIVRRVEIRLWDDITAQKPWLVVSFQKKDGDWGSNLFRAFNRWELVQRAIPDEAE